MRLSCVKSVCLRRDLQGEHELVDRKRPRSPPRPSGVRADSAEWRCWTRRSHRSRSSAPRRRTTSESTKRRSSLDLERFQEITACAYDIDTRALLAFDQAKHSLLRVKPATGGAEVIGSPRLFAVNAMAVRPSDGQVFLHVGVDPASLVVRQARWSVHVGRSDRRGRDRCERNVVQSLGGRPLWAWAIRAE